MAKGIFITGTGTDVGKTYVTALLLKGMREQGKNVGYYKAAASGAEDLTASDAGYVNRMANLGRAGEGSISYLYRNGVSPHLAAKWEGNPVRLQKVVEDYRKACNAYDYVAVEGSGGVVCPLRYDDEAHILLEDVVKALDLEALLVADAGLGVINSVTLSVEYLRKRKIGVKGVVLNRYVGGPMQADNVVMVQELAKVPVLARVKPYAGEMEMDVGGWDSLFS